MTRKKTAKFLAIAPADRQMAAAQRARLLPTEARIAQTVASHLDAWVTDYQHTVRDAFIGLGAARWDFTDAITAHIIPHLQADAYLGIQRACQAIGPDLRAETEAGYRDGFLFGLWAAYRQGVSLDEVGQVPEPTDRQFDHWEQAGAIGGAVLLTRVNTWASDAQARSRTSVNAMLANQYTLDQSDALFETLGDQLAGRLAGLGTDELQRAFDGGQGLAFDLLGLMDGTEWVWVTRGDDLVCPICQSLEGFVTDLVPVSDSHPRCRCRKVPRLTLEGLDAPGDAMDFEDFVAWYDDEGDGEE